MYKRSGISIGSVLLVVASVLLVLALVAGCGAMTSESKAIHAAEDAGYTDIEVIGKDVWLIGLRGCGESDNARFTVRGINPRGEKRELYVCAGVLKGGTIRSK